MPKITIPITEETPGMITAEPVRNLDNGIVYVGEGQELTKEIIENLKSLHFDEVDISVNSWDTVWKISKKTRAQYEFCTETAKILFQKVADDNVVDFEAFKTIKKHVESNFKDNFKIIGCINLFKYADSYTYTHSINVALLSMLIGQWMKYGDNMIESLLIAGLLHDIGKMKVDPAILNKPGKLTESEFEEMKKHPRYSYELLQDDKSISLDVKVGILMHHEKIDGSGYPYGVYSENINDIAKVLAVADVYDAMLSERPYKKKHSPFDVMQLMQEGVFGKLDTKILLTFLTHIASYYIGVYVQLSTGEIGEVVAINPACVYKPIVKVKDKYIDLFTEKSISIVELT
nr:HD-GYP domain-containing protein [uncultured Cellulosilyticum sp.]